MAVSSHEERRLKAPVYLVKPKYIFKHPFNKYDLSNPTNRETQNEELTDYFNYGFNQDTMTSYGKLVKRIIEVLDHRHNLEYFNEPSELMRLNDEIPMDFGGFCKFHDPSLVDMGTSENFHTGDSLMEYLVIMILSSQRIEFPLIELIKQIYKGNPEDENRDNTLYEIVEEISKNIERKYEETMRKIHEKRAEPKVAINKKFQPREKAKPVLEEVKREKISERRESSSEDSSDSSSLSRSVSRKRRRDRSSHKKDKRKDKKDRKVKKIKKEKTKKKSRSEERRKSKERSRSRDKKRKHR